MSDNGMSEKSDTKKIILNVKDLSFKNDQYVMDLMRYISETLSNLEITRNAMEVEIKAPKNMSKKIIKLRIKKFLHKKELTNIFRPISINNKEMDGYIVKEKKTIELSYY